MSRWPRGVSRVGLRGVMLVLALAGGVTGARGATRWEVLEAIHHVENPRDLTRPGRHGELGAYQFRIQTWRMHSKQPFQLALDRAASDDVAVRHYEWLKRGLERNGCEPTPYNIALAWNGGLSATVNGRAPAEARHYAERVANILAAWEARGAGQSFASVP